MKIPVMAHILHFLVHVLIQNIVFFTGLVPNQDECKPIIAIYYCASTSSGSIIVLFLKITRLTDNYNKHYTTFTICMTANYFPVFLKFLKYKALKELSVMMMKDCLIQCTDAVTSN